MASALQRLWRAPARAIAVGMIAATVLSSALLQSAASAALHHGAGSEARGLYDILVTAQGKNSIDSSTLLAPNSFGRIDTQLTLNDVEALRSIAGVDVAAPISQIIVPGEPFWRTSLLVPVDQSLLKSTPEDYRITVRVMGDDGTGERLLSEVAYAVSLDRAALPLTLPTSPEEQSTTSANMCDLGGVAIPCSLFGDTGEQTRTAAWIQTLDATYGSSVQSDSQTLRLQLQDGINIDQRMTLVDPHAERELLGDAGAFLDPLVAMGGAERANTSDLREWALTQSGEYAAQITAMAQLEAESRDRFAAGPAYAEYLRVKNELGEEPDPLILEWQAAAVVPMLVAANQNTPSLRTDISIENFGPSTVFSPLEETGPAYMSPRVPEGMRDAPQRESVTVVSSEASALLNPLSTRHVEVLWPGSSAPETIEPSVPENGTPLSLAGALGLKDLVPTTVGVTADGTRTARLDATGFRQLGQVRGFNLGADLSVSAVGVAERPGAEAAYFEARKGEGSMSVNVQYEQAQAISSFTEADLKAINMLAAGQPLGAYASPAAQLIEGTEHNKGEPGSAIQGFGPFGIAANQTSAIADISNVVWRKENRVDAVRVRVKNVETYDAAGIAAVTEAARAIENAGFRATIVAGSHTEPVHVSVGSFAFGTTDAAIEQETADLGVVEQQWTVLGAAASAGIGVGAATQLLIGTVLAAALSLFALGEYARVPARRNEAELLRSLGWRRGRIARWFAAEYAVAMLVVAASAALALFIAREPALTATVAGIGVIASLAISVWSLLAVSRSRATRTASLDEVERVLNRQSRPELRVLGAAGAGTGAALPKMSAAEGESQQTPRATATPLSAQARNGARLPRSAIAWGIQRAWRRRSALLVQALAIVVVMVSVGAFVALLGEMNLAGSSWSLGDFGSLLAPLVVALCGIGIGFVLILRLTAQMSDENTRAHEVLESSGWASRDVRIAARAESLTAALAAVLATSYALWFVLGALGVPGIQTAVTAALVAGLLASWLLVEAHFTSTPRSLLVGIVTRKDRVNNGATT